VQRLPGRAGGHCSSSGGAGCGHFLEGVSMENKDLIVIAAAAAAVWLIVKKLPALTAKKPATTGGGVIVNNADPGEPGWGWDYFDGGVAIGPDGSYYLNGNKVWSPA
jgi:hypothetical protein